MGKILESNICDEFQSDAKRYSLYVNRRRAIPDVRDGLKPVQRRIIWAAFNDTKCITSLVKSAKLVGDTMGNYHPHGDAAIYESMKTVINWNEINMPLFIGGGNWGSFQGSKQAADRYTEIKLSPFCLQCVLGTLKEVKETVDWLPTYDNSSVEPEFLPVEVPLLLINGNFGIGYGISTYIPKHNIGEVIDATINLIKHPESDVYLVPDTCMPCEIIETDFKSICNLGIGSFITRGKVDIEKVGNNRQALVIKSVPDLTYLGRIVDNIKELISKKQLPQISSMKDESVIINKKTNESDVRFVIELKAGADAAYVRDFIYKNTDLQKSRTINMEIIYKFNPLRVSYKKYLEIFLDFRKATKLRYYYNKLSKINTEFHKVDAFIKCIESGRIDDIQKLISKNNSLDDSEIVKQIADIVNITDLQASYIVGTNLVKLSPYHLDKYKQTRMELEKTRDFYIFKIKDEQSLLDEIIQELLQYKEKYNKPRKAVIISKSEMINIPQGRFKLIVTENNNIKKVPENASIGSFRDDKPKLLITGDNVENILIFTKEGKVYKLPIHKIPLSSGNSNGTQLNQISNKIFGNVTTVMYEPALKELTKNHTNYFISVLTNKGFIKKMDIDDFLAVPPSGIIYSKLENGDYITDVSIIGSNVDVVMYNWTNKALRINISDIPHLKRSTKGNITFSNIETGLNEMLGMSVIKPNDTDILVITHNGKINRLSVAALPCGKRNTTGSKVINLGKGDAIKLILSVNENDMISIQTQSNKYEIFVKDISFGSSVSSGVKVIPKNEHILDCNIIK